MSEFQQATATGLDLDTLVFDHPSASLLDRRRNLATEHSSRRRGWLVRRALLTADMTGLILAYLLAKLVVSGGNGASPWLQLAVMALTLPLWIIAAKLYGLYDRDEEHVDHSTIDEVVGVVYLVTLGAWLFFVGAWLAGSASLHMPRLILFWLLAILFVTMARGLRARNGAAQSALPPEHDHPRRRPHRPAGRSEAPPAPGVPHQPCRLRRLAPTAAEARARTTGARRPPRPLDGDHLSARHRPRDHRVLRREPRGAAPRGPRAPEARRADRRGAAPVRDRRAEGGHPCVRGLRPGRSAAEQAVALVAVLEAQPRLRGRADDDHRPRTVDGGDRRRDPARLGRACALPSAAARA